MLVERDRSSLGYRKAREEIWAGQVPVKYTRLLPYIEGSPILEIGSAEGVLALMLAKRGAEVTALELRPERHADAMRLRKQWRVWNCALRVGDIRENLDLLQGMKTFVAVRTLYYLRDDAPAVIAFAAQAGVRRVVLSGNSNRARQSATHPESELGRFNRLASVAGMSEVLTGAGFKVVTVVEEGDPIVVGVR
jgi:SAM-dependent methyltransferase